MSARAAAGTWQVLALRWPSPGWVAVGQRPNLAAARRLADACIRRRGVAATAVHVAGGGS